VPADDGAPEGREGEASSRIAHEPCNPPIRQPRAGGNKELPVMTAIQLYASSTDDPTARRAVDGLRVVLYLLLLLAAALLSELGADLDRQLSEALTNFPGFLELLWLTGFWAAVAWSVTLVVIAVARRRFRLAAAGVVAAVFAFGVAAVAAALVHGDVGAVVSHFVDVNGPPVFPPALLATTSAVIAVMAPYLTLPFRRVGRAVVAAQLIGALFLGAAQTLGAVAALAIGLLAGATINLLAGSPGGLPTVARVRDSLNGLGVGIGDLVPIAFTREGVARLVGTDGAGPIEVKVYGRDAWESELLAHLWRLAWYRGGERSARLRRGQYVEHEGFMTLLARDAGLSVPQVVIAGNADNGDALIVLRPSGSPLDRASPALTTEQVRALWVELAQLHAIGVIHHRIDLDRVVIQGDTSAGFSDLSSATVRYEPADEFGDRAQLLTLTILASGTDPATAEARAALGRDGLAGVLPYLQSAALPPNVRAALRRQHVDLDDVRRQLAAEVQAPEIELVKVTRVTWKSLLNLVLLAVAAYTIIGMIAGIDLQAFGRELVDANWWWLLAGLVIGQFPRVASAVSTMGSSPQPLPFGPTTALQFATCYVNLAVPSSAGRVAITTRFFQRFGVPPATALSAGVIDSVSELLIQLVLFVAVFFISDVDLGLSIDTDKLQGIATTALIVIAVVVITGLVALAVPSLRQRVHAWRLEAHTAVLNLRAPRKLLQLFGGNVLTQLLFAITLGACVRAFGDEIALSSLILVNTVVSLFAGLIPVPGGVGVTEAGISLGLTRAGLPSETAFAVALTYRFCVFYLPPIWGLQSYRWMIRHHYL
jgi:uncharacterized membrane protein YbhN (UPF0104 family)